MLRRLVTALGLGVMLAGGGLYGAEALVKLDLPAGPLEPALRAFIQQSGEKVIYPTDLVHEAIAPQVKGVMTAREGLRQLLSRTELSSWVDETTGAFAVFRRPNNRAIELPPYVIEEASAARWRYAEAPGIEVLSTCADSVTGEIIAQGARLHALLELLVPRPLQFQSSVPTTYVIFSDNALPPGASQMLGTLVHRQWSLNARPGEKPPSQPSVEPLENYRFSDRELVSIFFVWEEVNGNRGQLMLTPSFLRFTLESRTPALPRWYVDGMVELYKQVTMSLPPITRSPDSGGRGAVAGSVLAGDNTALSLRIAPFRWISERETTVVRQRLPKMPAMPPLAQLMSEHGLPPDQPEAARAEAALFLRYMLEGGPTRRAALRSLVELAATEPMTEALFRRCTGQDFAAMEATLREYLPSALKVSLTLEPPAGGLAPEFECRAATPEEISRIKGDFNRLEVGYVREIAPELTAKYLEQARRTLHSAYNDGSRDPRLLAAIGLCECDVGRDAEAEPFLSDAVNAHVIRPRAYYELARIRFERARAQQPERRLVGAELAGILQPLRAMRSQAPAFVESYELTAEALLCSGEPVTRSQLEELADGARLFPRQVRLLTAAALVNAATGRMDEARRLAEQGLAAASPGAEHDRLVRLIAALRAPETQPKR